MADKNKNDIKSYRKISRKKGNTKKGANVQVDIHSGGGAGSASVSEQSGPLG
jgi:hypothetical protein